MAKDADIQITVPCANLVGESPVWSVREQALYWIDLEGKLVQRFDLGNGDLRRWTMPEVTSCVGLRARGGLVAGTRTGFVFLDRQTGVATNRRVFVELAAEDTLVNTIDFNMSAHCSRG